MFSTAVLRSSRLRDVPTSSSCMENPLRAISLNPVSVSADNHNCTSHTHTHERHMSYAASSCVTSVLNMWRLIHTNHANTHGCDLMFPKLLVDWSWTLIECTHTFEIVRAFYLRLCTPGFTNLAGWAHQATQPCACIDISWSKCSG